MVRKSADSKRGLLQAQYKERVMDAREGLDKHLVHRAQTLAKLSHWSWEHWGTLSSLSTIGAANQPHGFLHIPLWISEVYWPSKIEVSIDNAEAIEPEIKAGQAVEYFQIAGQDGRVLQRSESLAEHTLPLEESGRDVDLFKAGFDDVALEPGVKLRVVTIRALPRGRPPVLPDPFFRFGPGRQPRTSSQPPSKGRPSGPRPGTGRRRDGPGPFFGPGPAVFIQYASDTGPLDTTLAGYRKLYEDGLAEVIDESSATLASLRTRLLWISGVAFVALAVGGFWLVRLGLLPLARVSEAVSRVSEKDFRLQVGDRRLPSELQPIVERLKQTLEQLQRAFAREKQAAADISHELRTPLAALLTTLDVGLRKERSAEEYQDLLRECRAAGQQMTHLVERLLALARLDAGVDHLRPRDVDAGQLAEECAAMVRPLAEARDVRLRVHRNGPMPVRTDPDKLREILTNLLHNAIQYNRPQGVIEVAVQRQNGCFDVRVQDTGIGIPPDVKDQIFERFYRADPSRHADDLHAGLGLAIVKGYVDLMGGTIEVDSAVGQGSTFRVRLPAGVTDERFTR
jgi:signal transduction histidine kinase